ncbi:MAG: DNA topoisomerase III [Clostridiales bacterium]
MGNILVLAEKPSVGRDIARVMGSKKTNNGFIDGNKYIVTWALGHLVTLADPGVYDKKYSDWKIEDIPIIPQRFRLSPIKNSISQFNKVKQLILRDSVKEIIIATDAGREGELVARWILDKIKVHKPIKRLWISSVTDKAIRDGFNNLKEGNNYYKLYQSAYARAEADWLVGINASRALTCKYNAQLSCGRVQTPTLQMVLNREDEIRRFIPKKYNQIKIKVGEFEFVWTDKSNETRIFDEKLLEEILNRIKDKKGKILRITKKVKSETPPNLYNLTEIQKEANKIFGYSAKRTLTILQTLYERYKILTYPRTDSKYLTKDIFSTLKDRLKSCRINKFSNIIGNILKNGIKESKNYINDSKVSDHHAVIPTEVSVDLDELSRDEYKIYELVIKRFLAVLSENSVAEIINVKMDINGEKFELKAKIELKEGWKVLYNDNKKVSNDKKNEFVEGEIFKIDKVIKSQGKTSHPGLLSEGDLISVMENPHKYLNEINNEWKKVLGETGGIGTVATRADIIEKLFNAGLMDKRDKGIYVTHRGKQLLNLVPEDLKSPILTAKWEKKLKDIEYGKLVRKDFINEMEQYTNKIVKEIKLDDKIFKHDNISTQKCSICGNNMLEVKNKRGKILVCKDRNCKSKKIISTITNMGCPQCRRKMELFGEAEKSVYVCKCGFKEKKNSFEKRLQKSKKSVSKKEVEKYLKHQSQTYQHEINNPMLEALLKLKENKK